MSPVLETNQNSLKDSGPLLEVDLDHGIKTVKKTIKSLLSPKSNKSSEMSPVLETNQNSLKDSGPLLEVDLDNTGKSLEKAVKSIFSPEDDMKSTSSKEKTTSKKSTSKTLPKFGESFNPKILITPKKTSTKIGSDSDNKLSSLFKEFEKGSDKKKSFNNFLDKKELMNRNELMVNTNYPYLYPSLDDPNFNIKIAERKEFFDTKNNIQVKDVQEEADKICSIIPELNPHQQFVRNFLSFSTPYNSLLLFHGLGTGKTCAAITVAEEQREYLKQLNLTQRIIVVASPNVQENFKMQLFDERKLELIDGLWNIKGCVGNKFIKEINPTNLMGLSKEQVVKQIKSLINNYYLFLGYIEFANFIQKKSNISGEANPKKISRALNKFFNNRLIIIDEVHNIRISDDNQNKRVAQELFKLVSMVDTLRLLLLSATPMYNSYKEIVWLVNIMNLNDRRSQIKVKDVFDNEGNFIEKDGEEVGKELLERKARGYISYIIGENPYSFPYKIWPLQFSPENSLISKSGELKDYPKIQLNEKKIIQPLQHLDVYTENIGEYQNKVYEYIIAQLKNSVESNAQLPNFDNMESFGYISLQKPLESLNMTYPFDVLDEYIENDNLTLDSKELVGKNGLSRIMKYTITSSPPSRSNFSYKDLQFGRIFSPDEIGKYSSKIKNICDSIKNSTGIVLIYSQYIDGGVLPLALALEEMGFTRYGTTPSLFNDDSIKRLDSATYRLETDVPPKEFMPAKYIMITGDKFLSPDSTNDIKAATSIENKNGNKIKVVLISQAGSEGIDFKFIRQVHILEPWYNMNRIEQIIGRGVRNCSHKDLPFIERNVEIFLHSILLPNKTEAVDLYVYRLAELKAVQIGSVSRLLKEISVDCLLNISQNNFNANILNQIVKQKLSNEKTIDYQVGNKPYTAICDYKESCSYSCKPDIVINKDDVNRSTYGESFIIMNNDRIIERIKQLMKDKYFYYKEDLIKRINLYKEYPIEQINYALTQLVNDRTEFIVDKLNRLGHLINIDELYIFQPIELSDHNISLYDRDRPIPYKRDKVYLESNKLTLDKKKEKIIPKIVNKQEKTIKKLKNLDKLEELDDLDKLEELDYLEEVDDLEQLDKLKEKDNLEVKNIIKELNKLYKLSTSKQLVLRGEKNYYKFFSLVFNELSKTISPDDLEKLLIAHLLEMLSYDNTLILVNYLYYSKLDDFENKLKKYYDDNMLSNGKIKGLLIVDKNQQKLIINNVSSFTLAESEDYVDLQDKIKELIIPIKEYNNIIGFIGDFKNDYNIFKVKFLNKKRHKGARCDQSPKKEGIDVLNQILGNNSYTLSNTSSMNHIVICIYQEMYLRYFNYSKKDDKVWFLTPSKALVNNIEKISNV